MLLSIALNYSYEDVNFALFDFKGGGTSNALKSLPHICGTLSNLDTKHMERALVSFQNECIERQKNIQNMNERSVHPITDITSYRKHLFQFKDMPKMVGITFSGVCNFRVCLKNSIFSVNLWSLTLQI